MYSARRETIPVKAIIAGAICICSKKVSELISLYAAVIAAHLFKPGLRAESTD